MSNIERNAQVPEGLFGGITGRPVQNDRAMQPNLAKQTSSIPAERALSQLCEGIDLVLTDLNTLRQRLVPVSRDIDSADGDFDPSQGESPVVRTICEQNNRIRMMHYTILSMLESLEV